MSSAEAPQAAISGALPLNGVPVLWSTPAEKIWIVNDTLEAITLPGLIPIGVAIQSDGSLVVADARTRSLVNLNGEKLGVWPDSLDAEQAIAAENAWLLLVRDERDEVRRSVVRWFPGAGAEVMRQFSRPVRITLTGDAVLVVPLEPPFWVEELDQSGTVVRRWDLEELSNEHFPPRARLTALPAIAIDGGHVVTEISDVTSEERLLVRLAPGGEVSATRVDAPLGFFGVDSEHRLLAAILEAGDGQVLFFRWWWSGSTIDSPAGPLPGTLPNGHPSR